MEVEEAIKLRRSTRDFKSKKISKENVMKIIESARLAPSAANRQPWQFVILDKTTKNKIADIMEKQIKKEDIIKDKKEHSTKPYSPTSSVLGSIKVIRQVPILILVFREKRDDWILGDYLSIGCAVENMCLMATNLHISSLIIRDIIYTDDLISKEVGYTDKELVVSIALGYSKDALYKRNKKDINDITRWY